MSKWLQNIALCVPAETRAVPVLNRRLPDSQEDADLVHWMRDAHKKLEKHRGGRKTELNQRGLFSRVSTNPWGVASKSKPSPADNSLSNGLEPIPELRNKRA